METSKLLMIGKGRIVGTFCDSFWSLSDAGKTGYGCTRYSYKEEIPLIISDLQRHRNQLLKELQELEQAEQLLKRAHNDPKYQCPTPLNYNEKS